MVRAQTPEVVCGSGSARNDVGRTPRRDHYRRQGFLRTPRVKRSRLTGGHVKASPVQLDRRSLADDDGPFNALGASLFPLTLAVQLSSFRIVPMPRGLVSSELLLLLNSSR
jgi:hypothetical protein